MSSHALHAQLLRPSVIHILRAAGFHSCKPSVIDALTDLAARYMFLLASNTARQVYDRTCTYPDHPSSIVAAPDGFGIRPMPSIDDEIPTITDIRLGMAASSCFTSTMTPSEEAWAEELRRPLSSFHPLARPKERARRDEEDTRDVREFIDWVAGPVNGEIRRIAGMLVTDTDVAIAGDEPVVKDDYLAALKKKHSKTGDGARYAGTVLGRAAEHDAQALRIEGGPISLTDWRSELKQRLNIDGDDDEEDGGDHRPGVKRKASSVDDFDEDAPLATRGPGSMSVAHCLASQEMWGGDSVAECVICAHGIADHTSTPLGKDFVSAKEGTPGLDLQARHGTKLVLLTRPFGPTGFVSSQCETRLSTILRCDIPWTTAARKTERESAMSLRPDDDRSGRSHSRSRDRSRSRSNVRTSAKKDSKKDSRRDDDYEERAVKPPSSRLPGAFDDDDADDKSDDEPNYQVRAPAQASAAPAKMPDLPAAMSKPKAGRVSFAHPDQGSDGSDAENDDGLIYGHNSDDDKTHRLSRLSRDAQALGSGRPISYMPSAGPPQGFPYPQEGTFMPHIPPDQFENQQQMPYYQPQGYSHAVPAAYQYAPPPDKITYSAKEQLPKRDDKYKTKKDSPPKRLSYSYPEPPQQLGRSRDNSLTEPPTSSVASRYTPVEVRNEYSNGKSSDSKSDSRKGHRTSISTPANEPQYAVRAPPGADLGASLVPDAGLSKRMNRLSVSGNRPDVQGFAPGYKPPNSPLLEAYRGTYQTASPMPSPMMLPADMDDIPALEPLSSEESSEGRKKKRSSGKKKKSVKLYDAEGDAQILAKALKHHDARTEPLIDILPELSHDQLLQLRDEYKKLVKVQGRGVNIAKQIKVGTSGNFGKAAYVTALGRWESEAYWANFWYQSRTASRELLIEALMGRTNADVREIKAAFKDKRYDDSLSRCMEKELKADKFRMAVLLALDGRRQEETDTMPLEYRNQDVEALHRALSSREGGETAILSIVVTRSDNHLREVLKTYERVHQANFARQALRKSNNLVGEVIAHILNGVINRVARDCLLLHHAIDDITTRNKAVEFRYELLMSRLVRLHWDRLHLARVKDEYRSKYGVSLERDIKDATKGDFGEYCLRVAVRRADHQRATWLKQPRTGKDEGRETDCARKADLLISRGGRRRAGPTLASPGGMCSSQGVIRLGPAVAAPTGDWASKAKGGEHGGGCAGTHHDSGAGDVQQRGQPPCRTAIAGPFGETSLALPDSASSGGLAEALLMGSGSSAMPPDQDQLRRGAEADAGRGASAYGSRAPSSDNARTTLRSPSGPPPSHPVPVPPPAIVHPTAQPGQQHSHTQALGNGSARPSTSVPPKTPVTVGSPPQPSRSRRGSFSFLRRSKSKYAEESAPPSLGPIALNGKLTRRRKSLSKDAAMPQVAPEPPQLPVPSRLPDSSHGQQPFGGPGGILPNGHGAGSHASAFPPSSYNSRYNPNAFYTHRNRMDSSQSVSGSISQSPAVDPYARTESMTNRGRYSYASSAISNVNSPRRVRRRKDPTPFNVLIVGTKNSGKTSFIEFLCNALSRPKNLSTNPPPPNVIRSDVQAPFTSHYLETELEGERIGLTLYDSKGLERHIVDLQLREMSSFIENKFQETFNEEQKVLRATGVKDTHIHCVILVLDPARLVGNIEAGKPRSPVSFSGKKQRVVGGLDEDLDVELLRKLQGKTTVIPIISKADTITTAHMSFLKRTVWDSLKKLKFDPLEALTLDSDSDSDYGTASSVLNEEDENDGDKPEDNLAVPSDPNKPPQVEEVRVSTMSENVELPYLPLSVLSPDISPNQSSDTRAIYPDLSSPQPCNPTSSLSSTNQTHTHLTNPRRLTLPPFPGTTRNTFQSAAVKHLAYTAYTPLALRTLAEIAAAVRARHSLAGVAITHRLGSVPVGEESVLICVSAPHRGAAWRAGEECLEEVKRRCEVWKREVFVGGRVAVGRDGEGGEVEGTGDGEGEVGVWRANRESGRDGERVNGVEERDQEEEKGVVVGKDDAEQGEEKKGMEGLAKEEDKEETRDEQQWVGDRGEEGQKWDEERKDAETKHEGINHDDEGERRRIAEESRREMEMEMERGWGGA
ncbi:hypothetical protein FH972_024197 [Carpinus fangiana]|uniref:Septin-type G domain-containing protein n=1 Tax=Carpinus fangiana TaxID=176857 RepID=A0A5N6KZV2_9ROSI|nr:hypothetical protein FH972_024197 [Carpinus fangiana]